MHHDEIVNFLVMFGCASADEKERAESSTYSPQAAQRDIVETVKYLIDHDLLREVIEEF